MAVAVREYVRGYLGRLRSGELGTLPIVLGLVVISVVFQNLNQNFLTAQNLANLLVQGSGVAVIAMGVVFILILGEIDLSVGYVSGVGAAILALTVSSQHPWPCELSVAAPVGASALIRALQSPIAALLRRRSFAAAPGPHPGWNRRGLLPAADPRTMP